MSSPVSDSGGPRSKKHAARQVTAALESRDEVFREAEAGAGAGTGVFELQPLMEMGVVGACRRGRRKGRRNRTATERRSEAEQRRQSKNARERERVENVRGEYVKLQKMLGLETVGLRGGSREGRRFCKLRILTAAIKKIKTLMQVLQEDDLQKRKANNSSAHCAPSVSHGLIHI